MNDPTPRRDRVIMACGISLFAMLFGAATTNAAESKPNVMVVFTADHGYADLSCQGVLDDIRTPNMDALSAVDDGVGRIVTTLNQCGLDQDTLIFIIGDNGASLKIHKVDVPGGGPGWDGSLNDPMNGEKGMLTEGGIRVPFVVHWKGKIPGGQVYSHPVISLDVGAMVCALARLPDDPDLDGVNLIPYLTGQKIGAPHERFCSGDGSASPRSARATGNTCAITIANTCLTWLRISRRPRICWQVIRKSPSHSSQNFSIGRRRNPHPGSGP